MRNTGEPDPDPDRNDREAVRAAEQIVSDAWIGRLLVVESEAQAAVDACTRVRKRAGDRVSAAEETGDQAEITLWQIHLELADIACGRAREDYGHARTALVRELSVWSEGTARRVRQSLSDKSVPGLRSKRDGLF